MKGGLPIHSETSVVCANGQVSPRLPAKSSKDGVLQKLSKEEGVVQRERQTYHSPGTGSSVQLRGGIFEGLMANHAFQHPSSGPFSDGEASDFHRMELRLPGLCCRAVVLEEAPPALGSG